MGIAQVRKSYGVPAKVGGHLIYTDSDGRRWRCRIIGVDSNQHIRARTDPPAKQFILHPTWNVEYL